ncbi:hypothetical protein CsSME_00044573 [Camellia sinensis var. sinensis]
MAEIEAKAMDVGRDDDMPKSITTKKLNDPELREFKDQILASETLPSVVNVYSWLLHSSLGQAQPTTGSSPLSSSTMASSSGDRGPTRGDFHNPSSTRGSFYRSRDSRAGGSCGGASHGGGSRGRGSSGPSSCTRGDRKCTHCGSQVNSHETLTTHISEPTALVQSLWPSKPASYIATLTSSGLLMILLYLLMDLLNMLVVKDLQTKRMIGSGHENDGLHFLDTALPPYPPSTVLSATVSPFQWHFHLGHPSLAKLNMSVSRTPKPFALIHTDI